MSAVAEPKFITIDEFAQMPSSVDQTLELIHGVLEAKEDSPVAKFIASRIGQLGANAINNPVGGVMLIEQLVWSPHWGRFLGRAPDVCFYRSDRLHPADIPESGPIRLVPDICVEVVSPTDASWKIEESISDYLRADAGIVWMVYPQMRMVRVHRADGSIEQLDETKTLTGETILPNLKISVAAIFPPRKVEASPNVASAPPSP